jgi:Ca2+-binding EF-hand superfamily protein
MDHGMKIDLDSKFRKFDTNNSGIIKKSDFINVLSENVRSISGSELYQFMSLFTTSFDDVVNYDDFLKILYKFGEMPMAGGNLNRIQIQDYSPTKTNHSQFEGI